MSKYRYFICEYEEKKFINGNRQAIYLYRTEEDYSDKRFYLSDTNRWASSFYDSSNCNKPFLDDVTEITEEEAFLEII